MTQRFILDENVVILAQKGENDRGDKDLTCLNLLTRIIRICHTIVVDTALRERYLRQLNRLRRVEADTDPRVLSELANAFQMVGKIDFRSNAPPFPEEDAIPAGSKDDTEIVRLAVETGAMLVTTDNPLRDDLGSSSIIKTYCLHLPSPEEALKTL